MLSKLNCRTSACSAIRGVDVFDYVEQALVHKIFLRSMQENYFARRNHSYKTACIKYSALSQ